MPQQTQELWQLVQQNLYLDPEDLFTSLEEAVQHPPLDFRTRLLIRDSLDSLQLKWGRDPLIRRLSVSEVGERLLSIWREALGDPGFPFLREQLMEPTKPETIQQFLRDLGGRIRKPVKLFIGGSAALLLTQYLSRSTQDIDIVDEVPAEIRSLHQQLDELMKQYRLQIAHFQSHYLPTGWQQRLHSVGAFGKLQVYLVDVYDIFLGKLYSAREKDRDDLRVLLPQLDKEIITRRLRDTTANLQLDEKLKQQAQTNWYVLLGEELPL